MLTINRIDHVVFCVSDLEKSLAFYQALGLEVDEGTQEVFVECFKSGGVLDRVSKDRPKELRAFLYGVVRNVARLIERRWTTSREISPPTHVDLDDLERSEATLSQVFDRWKYRIGISEGMCTCDTATYLPRPRSARCRPAAVAHAHSSRCATGRCA